jgi:hypothetical protein
MTSNFLWSSTYMHVYIQVPNVYIWKKERKTSHHLLLMFTKSTESELPKIDLQINMSSVRLTIGTGLGT